MRVVTYARAQMTMMYGQKRCEIQFTNKYFPGSHQRAMAQMHEEWGRIYSIQYIAADKTFSHRYDRWIVKLKPRSAHTFGFIS